MLKRVRLATAAILYPADIALTLLSLYVAEQARFKLDLGLHIGGQRGLLNWSIYAIVAVIWSIIFFLYLHL